MDAKTIARVKQVLSDGVTGPETIALMATSRCNLACLYCRGGRPQEPRYLHDDTSKELTTQQWCDLFEEAHSLRVREINIGGLDGEPFCRGDILCLAEKIKQLGLVGSITTNGSLLDAQAARRLSDCGWDILLLSLDSCDARLQETVRPARNRQSYYHRLVEFLRVLDETACRPRVLLNMVITRHNFRTLPDVIDFARHHRSVQSINLLKVLDAGLPEYHALQLDDAELDEFRGIIRNFTGEGLLLYVSDWLGDDRALPAGPGFNNGCYTNCYMLSIDANGDIIRCPQCQERVAGLNVLHNGLKDLWLHEHRHFRERLAVRADCLESCCTILKEQNRLIAESVEGR